MLVASGRNSRAARAVITDLSATFLMSLAFIGNGLQIQSHPAGDVLVEACDWNIGVRWSGSAIAWRCYSAGIQSAGILFDKGEACSSMYRSSKKPHPQENEISQKAYKINLSIMVSHRSSEPYNESNQHHLIA